jgi:small GTP-binding protein
MGIGRGSSSDRLCQKISSVFMTTVEGIFRPKLSLVGEPAVGKTSIISKWCFDFISPSHNITIGSQFHLRQIVMDGDTYDIEIRDTAGQEVYASLAPSYLRGSAGVFLVYSIDNRESFDKLPKWAELAKDAAPQAALLVFGNKVDLERAVTIEEGQRFSEEQDALFAEGSAQTGEGIEDAFLALIEKWNRNGRPGNEAPLLIPRAGDSWCYC